MAGAENVEWLGELDKRALYREIAKSELMLYPGVPNFAETGCIAATEAQACGTPLIATRIGAIPETLHEDAGRLIAGDSTAAEYQQTFAAAALGLLDDADTYRQAVEAGQRWSRGYDLGAVAAEWEAFAYQYFDDRFESRKPAILRQLCWYEDLRAANTLAVTMDENAAADMERWRYGTKPETPEEYAARAMDPRAEQQITSRVVSIQYTISELFDEAARQQPLRILDFAAGNGSYARLMLEWFPNATIDLVDYSQTLCEVARAFLAETYSAERFTTTAGSFADVPGRDYDLVFAGEIVEHFLEPQDVMTRLQSLARPDGLVLITTPQGPFVSWMHSCSLDWSAHARGHRVAFDARDWEDMLGAKPGFQQMHHPTERTSRGDMCGHWIVWWRNDGKAIPARDEWRHITRTRPYESLAVCMIARDSQADILRALNSVDRIADEIWVADTGSSDRTMELAKPFTRNGGEVWSIGTCPDAPEWAPPPGDFGWARNQSASKTTADWILWIDSDEELHGAPYLRDYMTDNSFNGYSIAQCHLTLDTLTDEMIENRLPYRWDKPIRLFRRIGLGKQAGILYQCRAAIHEHFQATVNDLINPALVVGNVKIAHTGYLTEARRRPKCQYRNIPLLKWDLKRNPDRKLARILLAREYVNLAKWESGALREQNGGQVVPVQQTVPGLHEALGIIHAEGFFDPSDVYWDATYEVYRDALGFLGLGHDYGVFVVTDGGQMRACTMRFLSDDDYEVFLNHQTKRLRDLKGMIPITWDDAEPAGAVVGMATVGDHADIPVTATGETTRGETEA
ncbi:MAG: methyltransferase domain-containing protein [Gemmatimonadaceae bacterium]|nr:methyltransferase domain-containing protein [Gemmatimonadaceae bacterium]